MESMQILKVLNKSAEVAPVTRLKPLKVAILTQRHTHMKRFCSIGSIALLITSLLSFPLMSQAAAGTKQILMFLKSLASLKRNGKESFDLTNQLIEEGQEAGSPSSRYFTRAINILTLLWEPLA